MVWRVATWNVNSLRLRLPQILAWWDDVQPEVLLLQETKVDDPLFPIEAWRERGLQLAFHGQKSYNGVAIISKFDLDNVHWGFNGEVMEEQARVISADVKAPGGITRVASLYLPNGNSVGSEKFEWKQRFVGRLKDWMRDELAANGRFVVGGDYNISVDERDVDDPAKRGKECMFTPEERQWMQDMFALGMADAFRLKSAESGVFSWWDYRMLAFQKNRGMRIDYNLVGPGLRDKVVETTHYRDVRKNEQPSDHVPVVTLFDE